MRLKLYSAYPAESNHEWGCIHSIRSMRSLGAGIFLVALPEVKDFRIMASAAGKPLYLLNLAMFPTLSVSIGRQLKTVHLCRKCQALVKPGATVPIPPYSVTTL